MWNCMSPIEPAGEVCREGDSSGVRFGHDPVQGSETAGESGPAEIWWWGHYWWHQVPSWETGRKCPRP